MIKKEIRRLLQKYRAKPIPMDKCRLTEIRPLSERISMEEVKRHTKAMQMSWVVCYRRIIGTQERYGGYNDQNSR